MSLKCPACKMESADGTAFCDFCKEPFEKKPKPVSTPAFTKEQMEKLAEMDVEALLKEEKTVPVVGSWLRPVAWGFLFLWVAGGSIALTLTYQRYKQAQIEQQPR